MLTSKALSCATLLTLSATFLPCAVAARSHPTSQIIDVNALPACHTRDGTRVKYVAVKYFGDAARSYRIQKNDASEAAENREMGLPSKPGAYVVYDSAMIGTLPLATQAYVMAHECGHHHLGHIDRPVLPIPLRRFLSHEREADCEGVRIMSETYGMSKKDIISGLSIFNSAAFAVSDILHDSGKVRYELSLRCIPDFGFRLDKR